MKICIKTKDKPFWHFGGISIKYFQNKIWTDKTRKRKFFTLQWKYKFEEADDEVHFAYSIPYPYRCLKRLISKLQKQKDSQKILRVETLCETIGGHKCPLLTISKFDGKEEGKKVVFLTARAHPGEPVSSWKMEGVIEFLMDPEDHHAEILRRNFIFKIIPMLNPDGVINGNFRCSLAGVDINRCWRAPKKHQTPTVFCARKLVNRERRKIAFFCDFHAHSKQLGSWVYGCNNQFITHKSKEFPHILAKMCAPFQFAKCK